MFGVWDEAKGQFVETGYNTYTEAELEALDPRIAENPARAQHLDVSEVCTAHGTHRAGDCD